MSGRYSKQKKKELEDYPHKLYMYGVTKGTFKSAASLREHISNSDFIPAGSEYYQKEGSNKRYVKKKELLQTTIISHCATQLRKDKKRYLKPFIAAIQEKDFEAQSAFLRENSTFKPALDQLQTWASDGFELSQIIELFAGRSIGLKEALGVSAGVWSSLTMLVREVTLGNIKMPSAAENGNNEEQKAENGNINNEHKAEMDEDSEMTSTNNSIKKEITLANCHIIAEIDRKEKESASNFGARSKQGRCNPYFKAADSKDVPRMFRVLKKEDIDKMKVIKGTNGTILVDTTTDYWAMGLTLLNLVLLYEHKCKKLHSRFMSGSDTCQRVLQRKRLKQEWQWLRPSAKKEFEYVTVLAEYLKLIVPIGNESSAYETNQDLMTNDEFSNDYIIGDPGCDYEGLYCRLPRSVNRIEEQKKLGKFRSVERKFWIRTDLAKVKAKMTDEEWTEHKKRLKECKVMSYMQSYASIFFRNKEAEYRNIGLIEDEDSDNDILLTDIEKKENEKELLDGDSRSLRNISQ